MLAEISRGDPLKRHICLTFDGGGGLSYAKEITTLLRRKKIQATFFLTGSFIASHAEDVKRIADDGHPVGNHTFSHPWLGQEHTWATSPGVTQSFFDNELAMAEDIFKRTSGAEMARLWRAPFGARNQEILSWGTARGLTHVYWSYDTGDWRTDPNDALSPSGTQTVEELEEFSASAPSGLNGFILLMHVGAKREQDPLLHALPKYIDSMTERGYSFVTAPEMIAAGSFQGGNLPLPSPRGFSLPEGVHQVGYTEGFYHDAWIAPLFTCILSTELEEKTITFDLRLPDFFIAPTKVSIYRNDISLLEIDVIPGTTCSAAVPLLKGSNELRFISHSSINPYNLGMNSDRRDLAAMLVKAS